MGEYFELMMKLKQGRIMSPWIFNLFFDRVVIQVNERTMAREVKLRDENGGGLEIKQVLYTDVTVLVVETREHLQIILSEFERACESMGLKITVQKSKGLMVKMIRWGVVRR